MSEFLKSNLSILKKFFTPRRCENSIQNEFNSSVIANLYEDMFSAADWSKREEMEKWLKDPALANLFGRKRLPFSDTTLLLIALFVIGDQTNNYFQYLDNVVRFMIEEMDINIIGVSQLPWEEDRLKEALKKSVKQTVEMGDFAYFMSSPGPNPAILMKRITAAYNQTRHKVLEVINRGSLSEKLMNLLKPFLDMGTRLEIDRRVEIVPPYRRDYLIALAIKNLAPSPGTQVPMDKIWRFIGHYFPFYEEVRCWLLDDLKNQVDFQGNTMFEFGGKESSFTVKLSLENTNKIMGEIRQFTLQNKREIEKCLRLDQAENTLYDMEEGMLQLGQL